MSKPLRCCIVCGKQFKELEAHYKDTHYESQSWKAAQAAKAEANWKMEKPSRP